MMLAATAMRKFLLRTALALAAFLFVAGIAYHFGLRNWCLHWGATGTEVRSTLPGDELLWVYAGDATHAITIHAPPEKVWPWLMQIGQDRSGFYSYAFLENLYGAEMPKVERLVPEWGPRVTGETVWFAPPRRFGGKGRMIAAIVEPEKTFAMVMANDWQRLLAGGHAQDALWSFNLVPLDNGRTRLIARLRGGTPPTFSARWIGRLFWEPAHFVMEQRMLRTIRDLAEKN